MKSVLFKGEMVRALMNCRAGVWPAEPLEPLRPWKFTTRRITKAMKNEARQAARQLGREPTFRDLNHFAGADRVAYARTKIREGFRWTEGDVLYIRENAWISPPDYGGREPSCIRKYRPNDPDGASRLIYFEADLNQSVAFELRALGFRKRASILLPEWASRGRYKVMKCGAGLLSEMTEEDAKAEGVVTLAEYAELWDRINPELQFAEDWYVESYDLKRLR